MSAQAKCHDLNPDEDLPDDIKAQILGDLDEFVQQVRQALAEGKFQAAIFTLMAEHDELDEDGDTQSHVWGWRHGYETATRVLLQDTIDRYTATMFGEGDGHEH